VHKPKVTIREKLKHARDETEPPRGINVADVMAKRQHREEVAGMSGKEGSAARATADIQALKERLETEMRSKAKPGSLGELRLDAPTSTFEAAIALKRWLAEPGALRIRYTRAANRGPVTSYFGRLLRELSEDEAADYGYDHGDAVFVFQQTVFDEVGRSRVVRWAGGGRRRETCRYSWPWARTRCTG
jgi:hypothetical protein